jgi:hypothetical protein
MHEEERKHVEKKFAALKTRHAQLQRYIDDSYTDKLDGKLSLEDWQRRTNKWREEQSEIEVQLTQTRVENQENLEDGIRLLELAQRAHSLYVASNYEDKREILNLVLSNFSFDGVTVSPTWASPFDTLCSTAKTHDWLGR